MLVIIFVSLHTNNINAETVPINNQSPSVLIEALKTGGHIIYMRHGLTSKKNENNDNLPVDLMRCETQRNLSEAGKHQVQRLGMIIKALNDFDLDASKCVMVGDRITDIQAGQQSGIKKLFMLTNSSNIIHNINCEFITALKMVKL